MVQLPIRIAAPLLKDIDLTPTHGLASEKNEEIALYPSGFAWKVRSKSAIVIHKCKSSYNATLCVLLYVSLKCSRVPNIPVRNKIAPS